MALDVKTASMAELQAEYLRLATVVADAQNTRKDIQQEIDRRVSDVRAQTRLAALTPQAREALRFELDRLDRGGR